MARHIAYDIGARGVTLALARLLDAPALLTRFSRLVIDPNRGEDDPTLVMRLYDGTIIPANRHVTPEEVRAAARRLPPALPRARSTPAIDRDARRRAARRRWSRSIPSRRSCKGRPPRPWQVGILWHRDGRLALPLIARLRAEPASASATTSPIPASSRATP